MRHRTPLPVLSLPLHSAQVEMPYMRLGEGKRWRKGERNPQENVLSLAEATNATAGRTVGGSPHTPCASENTGSSLCLLALAAQQTSIQPPKPNSQVADSRCTSQTPTITLPFAS